MSAKGQGYLIALEGTDGSGKATQAGLLAARLRQAGYPVAEYDFPQYDRPSSYFVRQYLKGAYGEATPYQASCFFALDRYDVAADIRKNLAEGAVVIANRYTFSNLAHQGGKIEDAAARRSFFAWAAELEHRHLGIPEPSCVLLLHMPASAAQKLMASRQSHAYLEGTRDIHESDLEHLRRAEAVYLELAELYKRQCRVVPCHDDKEGVKSIPEIQELVWQEVRSLIGQP